MLGKHVTYLRNSAISINTGSDVSTLRTYSCVAVFGFGDVCLLGTASSHAAPSSGTGGAGDTDLGPWSTERKRKTGEKMVSKTDLALLRVEPGVAALAAAGVAGVERR